MTDIIEEPAQKTEIDITESIVEIVPSVSVEISVPEPIIKEVINPIDDEEIKPIIRLANSDDNEILKKNNFNNKKIIKDVKLTPEELKDLPL